MKKYKLVFIDLDNTITETISGENFPIGIWDMRIRFDVLDAIKQLSPDFIQIVSDQKDNLFASELEDDAFEIKMKYISTAVASYTGIDTNYFFSTGTALNGYFSKPNKGMFEIGCAHSGIHKKSTMLLIGNDTYIPDDSILLNRLWAANYGIDYMDVHDFMKEYSDTSCEYCRIESEDTYKECKPIQKSNE